MRIPKTPPVDVSSPSKLLLTANRVFPLVTIHFEHVDPEVCHFGEIVGLKNGRVSMHEIGPDAAWEDKPISYPLSKITRVDFGGDYEEALALVGGLPPSLPPQ